MKHLGDISRITKEDAVPVDCITFKRTQKRWKIYAPR